MPRRGAVMSLGVAIIMVAIVVSLAHVVYYKGLMRSVQDDTLIIDSILSISHDVRISLFQQINASVVTSTTREKELLNDPYAERINQIVKQDYDLFCAAAEWLYSSRSLEAILIIDNMSSVFFLWENMDGKIARVGLVGGVMKKPTAIFVIPYDAGVLERFKNRKPITYNTFVELVKDARYVSFWINANNIPIDYGFIDALSCTVMLNLAN